VDISLVSQVIPRELIEEEDSRPPTEVKAKPSTTARSINRPVSVSRTAESPSSGSPGSSSEGGSVERITSGVQAMGPFRFPSDHSNGAVEHERGRSQAPTPIQGNTMSTAELPLTLNPQANEVVLYQSLVEVRSIRRRASRLLKPIPGTQIKPKTREIILTNHRLICLKTKNSPTRSSVKSELFIKAGEEGKEKEKKKDGKDAKGILVSAELKGDREFAVLSSIKTFHYATEDASTASLFVEKINTAISSLNVQS